MTDTRAKDFIREIIDADLETGRHQHVVTRFPPEPNGYLHIGHAKSIWLNYGIARDYGGTFHLRFDDTNPTTEDPEYVESIQRDVRWLGAQWHDKLFFASDYFERLYQFAVELIEAGKAYVCSLDEEQIRELRGTITQPGRPSPYRERSVAENLALFSRMRAGEFPDGAHVLRAKIDMASPNMKMRDPLLYRIRHAHHYRTGDAWCIYPLYDFTHCLSDALEGITHSICTLEFENNRELYDWVLDNVTPPARPHQYEFARLNLNYTVMSKRKLLELVQKKLVAGWDDPRMPTIAGLRRRGVTPDAIRAFCERIGVAKNNSVVDVALFEHTLREDLNLRSPRVLAVLDPLPVTIDTLPEGDEQTLDAPLWPHDVPKTGSRPLPLTREILIERDDFAEVPPKGWHRLAPGAEVRLRHGPVLRCERVEKDAAGRVSRLICSHDAASIGDASRKVKGTIHWVSAARAVDLEVRVYDRLFDAEHPGAESGDPLTDLNPNSLTIHRAKAEPSLAQAKAGEHYQLERLGFFFVDPVLSKPGAPVLNRSVALRDTWAKVAAKATPTKGAAPKVGERSAPKAAPKTQEPLSPEAEALVTRGVGAEEARVLADDASLRSIFDAAVAVHDSPRAVASWLVNELPAEHRGGAKPLPFDGAAIAELVKLVDDGTINGKIGKDVLAEMLASGKAAAAIVSERGLTQIADASALTPIVDDVLDKNADAVERYRGGNKNLLGAFVGMVMKASGGKANPKLVSDLLRARLG